MEQKLRFSQSEQLDLFIQKSLDKFFFVEPWKKLYDRTGKLHKDVITDKSTIPDLIIYNKAFNKVDCYFDCKKKLLINYPRKRFQFKPKYKKEYNPSSTYGDENEISFYINKVPNELSKNELNKSLNINKEKNKYSEFTKEDKKGEDDDDNEPEWANDNVEDYSNSKIEFKAIPKSLEEKIRQDFEFSKDKIPNKNLDKITKNNVNIDEFFNNYDNNLNVISPIKYNKNNDIYDELKEFMSKDSKNNNANYRNDIQNNLYDKNWKKNKLHFNIFDNQNKLKNIFNNERFVNSTDENNPKNYNNYNFNLNRINDIRLLNITNNENNNKILQLQNIYQKYKMAQMYNYINYLKALNNIIQQPNDIQYNNNLYPQNQIPIFNNQNNVGFNDIKYLNNYNFQNLENFQNYNLNNSQFINQNIWNNTPNSNLYNNFNEFNDNNISKFNLIKHNMNNMNDLNDINNINNINNRNKVLYVNNLNNLIFKAQKFQNNSNSLNFGRHQKLSGNFNNIKYNDLNNNLNQIISDNRILYKNFDNVKYYNNNINNINNKTNIDNNIINIPNNLIDNREMIDEQIKLENDLKVNDQNKYEKDNIDLNPVDYLENPMLILVKNIKKKNWLVFNKEGNVLHNYNSEELYYFLDEKNKGNSLEEFTINDYDTDIMFPTEFIYNYLKKYYSK